MIKRISIGITILIIIYFIFSAIFIYYCLNNNGKITVGKITSIIGRETNSAEYAEYFYEVLNENSEPIRYFGSSMIVGPLDQRDNIIKGRKFIVIYCGNVPRVSRMHFKVSSDAAIGDNLNLEYDLDTMQTRLIEL